MTECYKVGLKMAEINHLVEWQGPDHYEFGRKVLLVRGEGRNRSCPIRKKPLEVS